MFLFQLQYFTAKAYNKFTKIRVASDTLTFRWHWFRPVSVFADVPGLRAFIPNAKQWAILPFTMLLFSNKPLHTLIHRFVPDAFLVYRQSPLWRLPMSMKRIRKASRYFPLAQSYNWGYVSEWQKITNKTEIIEIWGSPGDYYYVVVEVLGFVAVCICR